MKCLKNVLNNIKDLFISVAAVSDWKIKKYNSNKIKKKL